MELKVLLSLLSVCFATLVAQTQAGCVLDSTLDPREKPMFFRNTTTRTTLVPQYMQSIYMQEKEEIIGHCKSRFESPSSGYSQITITCLNRQLYVRDNGRGRYSISNTIFKCTPENGNTIGTCNTAASPVRAVRPKFFKRIGSRTIQISPEAPEINVQYDQQLIVRCDTKFKSPRHLSTELILMCLNNQILLLDHPYQLTNYIFECESLQWNLYESITPFPWCPSSMASYILARPLAHGDWEYLAGICYDFYAMSFKSLYYAVRPKFAKHLSPSLLTSFSLAVEISDINENFVSKKTFTYDNPQIEKWIQFSKYENKSIVQNSQLHHDIFQQFEQLLSVDWWPNLMLGNWQFYEQALARHVEEYHEYNLLAGISRAVAAPVKKENCSKNLTMTALVDDENNGLPLYIWNYLQAMNDSSDDVVIIGVNTPFYDFYDETELVFCKDICHQLHWLEDIRATFRYRPMGVMFCCSVQEVVASGRLDGFAVPTEFVQKNPMPDLSSTTSFPETATAEIEESSENEITTEHKEYDEYGNLY